MEGPGRIFLGLLAAKMLTLLGIVASVIGLFLTIMAMPGAWLAWSGALLSIVAFAAFRLLARGMQRGLSRTAQEGRTTIYMPLLNEATVVWRPVEAMKINDFGYMVTEHAPPGEEWAFQPGQILRCENREFDGETHLAAVAKAA